jgi:hypothetical protein
MPAAGAGLPDLFLDSFMSSLSGLPGMAADLPGFVPTGTDGALMPPLPMLLPLPMVPMATDSSGGSAGGGSGTAAAAGPPAPRAARGSRARGGAGSAGGKKELTEEQKERIKAKNRR